MKLAFLSIIRRVRCFARRIARGSRPIFLAALAAALTGSMAPDRADARVNPLAVVESQIRKANMLIVLDTSGSMNGVPGGQFQHTRWQFPSGQSAKMAFNGGAQIRQRIRNPDRLAAEADDLGFPSRIVLVLVLVLDFIGFAAGPGFNADRVAAQENLRSNMPCRWFPGL